MSLPKQIINLPFGAGEDTKTDAFQVQPPKLTSLTNAVLTNPGKIQKRPGTQSLSNAINQVGTLSRTLNVATRGNELVAYDGNALYSWDSVDSQWSQQGYLTGCTVTQTPVARPNYNVFGQDISISSKALLFVYELSNAGGNPLSLTSQGVFYTITDSATGAVLASGLLDANARAPKALAISATQFAVFYVNSSDKHLYVRTIGTTTPFTVSSATKLDTGTLNDSLIVAGALSSYCGCYDACNSGSDIYLAFRNNNGGASIYWFSTLFGLWTLQASAYTSSGLGVVNVGVFMDNHKANGPVLLYATTTPTVNLVAYNESLTSQGSGQIDTTIFGSVNAGQLCGIDISASAGTLKLQIFYSFFQASATNSIWNSAIKTCFVTGSYSISTPTVLARSVNIAGKPLLNGAAPNTFGPYLPVSYSSNVPSAGCGVQPTYFLLDCLRVQVIARWFPGLASSPYFNSCANYNTGGANGTMLPESIAFQFGVFFLPSLATNLQITTTGRTVTQTGLSAVKIVLDYCGSILGRRQTAELAGALHINGGVLFMYDGTAVVEQNFHLYPDPVTVTTSTSGGSIAAGTYQYVALYSWMDAQGNVHRSTQSVAVSQTTTGTSSTNTLTIPTLRLTQKTTTASPVLIELYRTQNAGTTFYLLTSNFAGTTGTIVNSTTTDAVTFTDTSPDSQIASSPQLYTTGNVLADAPPNPSGALCVHHNRLHAVDSTNPLQLFVSKQVIPPSLGVTLPVEFSQSITLNVDPRGGATTAVASMDEKLIIFKGAQMFLQLGQGPDATGGQNDWSDPIIISSDVGCPYPNSIVMTPLGLMFQSLKGIYLLNRALQVEYIGADVETTLSTNGPVTCATLTPGDRQVRFGLGANNPALVYDLYTRQWYEFSYAKAVGTSAVWPDGNIFVYGADTSGVVKELSAGYQDDAANVGITAATGWIHLAEIQGYQRFYKLLLLGNVYNALTLTIYLDYDYSTANRQTLTVSFTGSQQPMQVRLFPNIQKAEAIRVTIIESSSTGQGFDLSGVALEVGVKYGLKKLGASGSFG